MNTTFKKKTGVVLFIIFAIFCGLQFVFNNSLTANAEIALKASADGSVKTSANSLTLHPYSYSQDFEGEDPFKLWTSNGTYTVNYKGLTTERASSGKQSVKIDITFDTATYVYFKIPVMIPSIGRLNFKGDIYVSQTTGASAALGTNISLYPCPHSGVNILTKQSSPTNKWVSQESDIITIAAEKAGIMMPKYCAESTVGDAGIWTDTLALYLFGKSKDKITVFVDNLSIVGNIPDKTEYTSLSEASWANYKNRLANQVNQIKNNIGNYKEEEVNKIIAEFNTKGYLSLDGFSQLQLLNSDYNYLKADSNKSIIVYPLDAISDNKILPDTYPILAPPKNDITISACRNEFEPASFILRSAEKLSNIEMSVTDLKSEDGNLVIPNKAVDIRIVKAWYQSSDYSINNNNKRILTPELLLKDDSLIKVDYDNKKNYLKIYENNSESNPNYIDISSSTTLFPENGVVKDSEILKPFSMEQNTNKQIWLTFHVPANATTGNYLGKINITNDNNLLRSINISLTVLPFDLSKNILEYSLYYRGKLTSEEQKGINSEYKTSEQYKIELKNMFDHGIDSPNIYQELKSNKVDEALELRQEVGFSNHNLYVLGTTTGGIDNPTVKKQIIEDAKEWIKKSSQYLYSDVYIYGIDEAEGEKLKIQIDGWRELQNNGAKIFVACFGGAADIIGTVLDKPVLHGTYKFDKSDIPKWTQLGKKILLYGEPQVGIENSFIYRKNYGFFMYSKGYDGCMNYAYQHSYGHIWNDFDHETFRDHVFAYPTSNGIIDTIQWEGFREGVDDMRYFSTLLNNNTAKKDEYIKWLNDELQNGTNPQEIRTKIIAKIMNNQ